MRVILSLRAILCLFVLFGVSSPKNIFGQYCPGSTGSPCSSGGYIRRVALSNIDNVEDLCDRDNLGGAGFDDGYSDYTDKTIVLKPGANYQITVEVGAGLFTNVVSCWIDWNQDRTWSEDELLPLVGEADVNIYTIAVVVPPSAVDSVVGVMRVIMDWTLQPYDPCTPSIQGEVEDYSFIVTDSVPPVSGGGPVTYCQPINGGPCTGDEIKRFALSNVDNNNELCDKEGSTGPDGYSDYSTDFLIVLNADTAFTATLEILNPLTFDVAAFWLDWNADGTWDETEHYPMAGQSDAGSFTAVITAPPSAVLNKVGRIRVISDFIGPDTDPCASTYSGEIEDYSFILLPAGESIPPCVNTALVIPANGADKQCNRQTLSWPSVPGASYVLSVRDTTTNTYITSNLALATNFYSIPATLSPGHVYSWIAKTIKDGTAGYNCDSAYFTTSINADPVASILPSTDTAVVCLETSLTLDGNPSLGTTPYIHTWSNDTYSQLSNTTIAQPTFYSDSVGFFKLAYSVKDDNNCRYNDTVTVKVLPKPKTGSLSANQAFYCAGSSATMQLTGYSGTITWQDSSATSSWSNALGTSPNDSTLITNALQHTTAIRAVLFNGNCYDTTTAFLLDVRALPTPPTITISGNDSICPGESTTLMVTNYSSNIGWNDPLQTQAANLTVSTPGTYQATVTDVNNCKSSSSITVFSNIPEAKPTVLQSGPSPICNGDTVTLSATGTNLEWVSNVTTPVFANSIGATLSGKYAVRSTNQVGCSSLSDSVSITFLPKPPKPSVTSNAPAVICDGMIVKLSSAGPSIGWNTGVNGSVLNVSSSGSYFSIIQASNGCKANSDTVQLVFNPLPTKPSVTSSASDPLCDGEVVVLTATGGPINWNTNSSATTITAMTSGDYYVYSENTAGCKNYSDTITLLFNPKPSTPTIILGNNRLEATAGGTEYRWINAAVTVDGITTTSFYTPTSGGPYRVVFINEFGCASDTSSPMHFSGTGINTTTPLSVAKLYPNPSNGELTFDLTTFDKSAEIVFVDALGRSTFNIHLEKGIHTISVPVVHGVYLVLVNGKALTTVVFQ